MKLAVTAEARAFRRAVGVTAWSVLEELVLDADVDDSGALVARTNVRAVAAQLGVSKDTSARAITRLMRAGAVARRVGERGDRGALPTSSYGIDLAHVAGVDVCAHDASIPPTVKRIDSPQRTTRRTSRPATRADNAQASLFDLPASVS